MLCCSRCSFDEERKKKKKEQEDEQYPEITTAISDTNIATHTVEANKKLT